LRCTDEADWRRFKVWLKRQLREAMKEEFVPFDVQIKKKYEKEVDICVGKYEEVGKVKTEFAAYKYDFTYFMTPEEISKHKELPTPLVAPKSFDISKAERVIITKEDLKQRELDEEQESLKYV
jgi:hypothetical protein